MTQDRCAKDQAKFRWCLLAVSFAREGRDEGQARSLVDVDCPDDHLDRATFADREVLVPRLFLGEQASMHGRKLFPGTSYLVRGASYDARRRHAYRTDRQRHPDENFKLRHYPNSKAGGFRAGV